MSITCPGCQTSYAIPAEVLMQAQTVRCVRCHHNWQPAPEETAVSPPEPAQMEKPEERFFCDLENTQKETGSEEAHSASSGRSGPSIPGFLHFDIEPEATSRPSAEHDMSATFAPRRESETLETPEIHPVTAAASTLSSSGGHNYGKLFAATLALTLFGGGIAFKQTIIAAVPETAGIYRMAGLETNITGLKFVNVATSSLENDGIEQLIVSGEVENFTTGSIKVPEIRISMRDNNKDEIFFWTAVPEQSTLTGGQKTVFRSTINTPPDEAKDLKIHFSDPTLESR